MRDGVSAVTLPAAAIANSSVWVLLAATAISPATTTTAAEPSLCVGDELRFRLGYGALLGAMHSRYVDKQIVT
jgi:hypothetical protein